MDSEINLDTSIVAVEEVKKGNSALLKGSFYEKGKGPNKDAKDAEDGMNYEEEVQKGDGNNHISNGANTVTFKEEGRESEKGVEVSIDDELRRLVGNNNNNNDDDDDDETTSSPTTGIRQRKPNELKSRASYRKDIGDNLAFRDHFSLANPSSHVSFFDREAVVYVHNLAQITLEKRKDDSIITAKHSTTASPGLLFLRIVYTLQALLVAGFLFVFCIEAVLFLFLGVMIGSGM